MRESAIYRFAAPSWDGDLYAQRIRGYILAPSTGDYTFWVAGDDVAELWLGTGADPGTKALIAYTSEWTYPDEWNKSATQQSDPIPLVADNLYYVEALMKENVGGDNLSVGWRKPGEVGDEPSEVVPGQVLLPFPYQNAGDFEPQPFVSYFIRPQVSGLALSADAGTFPVALGEKEKDGRLHQLYNFEADSGGYRISAVGAKGVLSALGTTAGSSVVVVEDSAQATVWKIEAWSTFHYHLVDSESGLCLHSDGGGLTLAACAECTGNNADAQRFALLPAKKGLGGKFNDAWTDPSWFYWWSAAYPTDSDGIEWVPMIERPWYIDADVAAELRSWGEHGLVTTLLAYNEPENAVNDPVVTVEDGLAVWSYFESTGLRLGSPACIGGDTTWCPAFMDGVEAQGFKMDFVAVHWYGVPKDHLLFAEIDRAWELWGLPIWITEFGCVDWGNDPSLYTSDDVVSFLKRVLPVLDADPRVERYAFYPFLDNESSFADEDGSMSDVARVYMAHPFND